MLNRVMLIGNVGQDPELRHTQGGNAVLNLRLATNESYLQDGERKTRTEWHTVIMWGKRGEALNQYITRGSRIYVEGRLQTRSYETRDGQKRHATEVVATDIILLGDTRVRSSPRHGELPDQEVGAPFSADSEDDQIPY